MVRAGSVTQNHRISRQASKPLGHRSTTPLRTMLCPFVGFMWLFVIFQFVQVCKQIHHQWAWFAVHVVHSIAAQIPKSRHELIICGSFVNFSSGPIVYSQMAIIFSPLEAANFSRSVITESLSEFKAIIASI